LEESQAGRQEKEKGFSEIGVPKLKWRCFGIRQATAIVCKNF
jgi:hypothetical protein